MENIYYTYVYCDPRKAGIWITEHFTFFYEPFYVGEGKNKRIFDHLHDKTASHKVHKIRKIQSLGLEPIIFKLTDQLTGDEGLALEASMIRELGTVAIIEGIKRGPLTNLRADVSSKRVLSEEVKNRIGLAVSKATRGVKHSITRKQNNSLAKIGKKHSDTRRYNNSQAQIKYNENKPPMSDEERAKRSYASSQQKHTDERRRAISLANSSRSPELIAQIAKSNTRKWILVFSDQRPNCIIDNLGLWCTETGILYNTIRNTLYRSVTHKGIKLVQYPF